MLYDMSFTANVQELTIDQDITLVSGSKNIYRCTFGMSDEWTGFTPYAVFKNNKQPQVEVELDANNQCIIPPGAVAEAGLCNIGLCGVTETQRMPTNWIYAKVVEEGAVITS